MRLRKKAREVPDLEPVVFDRHGRPVGVRTAPAPAADDSPQASRMMKLDALRRTHELEGQYRLRCQVSLFCSDPPR
jgi:hypothetical protein